MGGVSSSVAEHRRRGPRRGPRCEKKIPRIQEPQCSLALVIRGSSSRSAPTARRRCGALRLLCFGSMSSPFPFSPCACVAAAEQTAHSTRRSARAPPPPAWRHVFPHAGPAMRHESMTQRSPSIRARARARGPQRLCSLNPDTCAAVPSPWRSRRGDPTRTVRAARVRRADATGATRLSRSRPRGTTPVVTYRHSAITSLRATATIPIRRARFPFPKCALIPLRQRALRLPPHPIPRELNTDRLAAAHCPRD